MIRMRTQTITWCSEKIDQNDVDSHKTHTQNLVLIKLVWPDKRSRVIKSKKSQSDVEVKVEVMMRL